MMQLADASLDGGPPSAASPASARMTSLDRTSGGEPALFSVAVEDHDQFRFEGFNPAAERLTGMTNADLVGRTPEEVTPGHAALVTARYRQCVEQGVPLGYLETLEFPTGTSHWRTTLEPVCDHTGRVVRILGSSRQIEVLDGTHEELTDVEFQRALRLFPTGMALLDAEGLILFVNSSWEKFGDRYGGTKRPIGELYVDVCRRSTSAGLPDAAEVEVKLRRLLFEGADHFGHPYVWRDRHFVLRATRVVLNGRVRIIMAHQDVTDVVTARALAAALADDLHRAQEEERSRIALELHDSTSQHLVAAALGLGQLERSGAPSLAVAAVRHAISEAQREIRSLTYLLYPPALSSDGLEETLQRFIEGYGRRSSLSVSITMDGPLNELPGDVQLAVLRVVQEALGNVHRHAQAQTVSLRTVREDRGLRLTIADDGKAAVEQEHAPTGVGIRGMQARFARFGGRLSVTQGPEGTRVEGFLPQEGIQAAARASQANNEAEPRAR